jgi:hypothetical protein
MDLCNQYVDMLKPAGDLINETWTPNTDKAQAELCRQLAMNLSRGYFLAITLEATPYNLDRETPDTSFPAVVCRRSR